MFWWIFAVILGASFATSALASTKCNDFVQDQSLKAVAIKGLWVLKASLNHADKGTIKADIEVDSTNEYAGTLKVDTNGQTTKKHFFILEKYGYTFVHNNEDKSAYVSKLLVGTLKDGTPYYCCLVCSCENAKKYEEIRCYTHDKDLSMDDVKTITTGLDLDGREMKVLKHKS